MENERIWSYSEDEHAETLEGHCGTAEEAILEAHAEYDGDVFWLYECRPCHVSEFVPSADDVISMMNDRATDRVGDAAEEFPDVDEKAEDELNALLNAWAEKHCVSTFWTTEGCATAVRIAVDDPRRFPKEIDQSWA